MGDILKNWLVSQIGIKVNLDPIYLSKTFQDGVLFKQILNNYGIISHSYTLPIVHSTDFKVCQQNLKQLCVWFNLLNINFDDHISEIANGQCSSIIRLLYEMFICFENKQHLYFVSKQCQRNIHKSIVSRFQLGDTLEPNKDNKISLERPLFEHVDINEWYKEKYGILKKKFKSLPSDNKSNNKAEQTFIENRITNNNKFQNQFYLDDYSKHFLENGKNQQLPFTPFSKDEYLLMLKLKKHKKAVSNCLTKKMQTLMLNSTWEKIHNSQETKFNELLSKLLIKQSQYEKQLVMKLLQENEGNKFQTKSNDLVDKEKEHLCNLQLLDDFERGKCMYEDEKQRILELHNRLYEEKQKAKALEHFKFCSDVIDSMINLCIRVSEYTKLYDTSVPESDWNDLKQLFCKGVYIPPYEEEIVNDNDIDDNSISIISMIHDYSEVLNEYNFYEYNFLVGPWFVEEIFPELGSPNEDEQNVLGYIVHRLLELKYPFPPSPEPAQIPPMKVTATIQGLLDDDTVRKLKLLMTKPEIVVVEINDLLNISIDAYKVETNLMDVGKNKKNKNNEKNNTKSKVLSIKSKNSLKNKQSLDSRKSKTKRKSKNNKLSVSAKSQSENDNSYVDSFNLDITMENEKRTQTPAVLPEEDDTPKRTEFSLLGEQIYNILTSGLSVSDSLLVTLLTEYLKLQHSKNGLILINFPNSINQASMLELTLTGRKIPDLEIDENMNEQNEIEEFNKLRISSLVPYPSFLHMPAIFKTYFTKVIFTKLNLAEKNEISVNNVSSTDNSGSKLEEEPALNLESLYRSQDVFSEFCYDQLDLNTLKLLARQILSGSEIEQSSSIELFGKEILATLSGTKKQTKTKKEKPPRISKKEMRGSKASKKKVSKVPLQDEMESSGIEDQVLEEQDVNIQRESSAKEPIKEILKPGDSGWNYTQLEIPNILAVALATLWESIEKSYVQNLKQQFFNKRTLFSHMVPYKNFVSKTIIRMIEAPDDRQTLVTEFQNFHNSIEEQLLQVTEMKCELECKVFELQNKLWLVCDEEKVKVSNKLKDIINDNWVAIEMCFLTNVYLSLVQVELDRYTNTLTLLSDYYLLMLNKPPSNDIVNISVSTLDLNSMKETFPESANVSTINLSDQQHSYTNIFDYVIEILSYSLDNNDIVINPFCIMLENKINKAIENLDSIGSNFESIVKKEENLLLSHKKNIKGDKSKTKPKKSVKENSVFLLSDETDISTKDLFEEWAFVLKNEIIRTKYRCNLIKCRAIKDLSVYLNDIASTFHNLFIEILNIYCTSVETVDNICKIFFTAIEDEVRITQKLIIHDDMLLVLKQEIQESYYWPKELFEHSSNYIFSTQQAKMLILDLKIAAPSGTICKTPLLYILEDVLLKGKKENIKCLPELWDDLETKELKELIDTIFGNVLFVDWRDFIIYCLNIPFPTTEELLVVQMDCEKNDPNETETLNFENYNKIVFWFEKELADSPQDRLKFVKIKNLLYNLFKDENNNVIYTALLLSFCKETVAEEGFGKALSLAVSKRIITCESDLYLEQLVVNDDEEKLHVVNNILSGIINMVIISTECTIITEVNRLSEKYSEEFNLIIDPNKSRESQTSEYDKISYETENTSKSRALSVESSTEKFQSNSSNDLRSLLYSTSELCCVSLASTAEGYFPWISQVSIETILSTIVTTIMPRSNTLYIQQILDELIKIEVNGLIPVYLLFDLPSITDLFLMSQKFKIQIVHEIIVNIKQKRCKENESKVPHLSNSL